MCLYVCLCVCVCVCVCVLHIFLCICMHANPHVHMHVHEYACTRLTYLQHKDYHFRSNASLTYLHESHAAASQLVYDA